MSDLLLASPLLAGRSVTMELRVGATSYGSATVPAWGQPDGTPPPVPTATVTVEVTESATGIAPAATFFKVTDWQGFDTVAGDVPGYDARQMDLVHIWSFGDPDSFVAPEKVLPEWREANTARGPFVAHCYRAPGNRRWNLTVIEPLSGKIATATGIVQVKDPSTAFLAHERTYVSQAGNFSACPATIPQSQRFTTINGAREYLRNSAAKGLVMLARGETFSVGTAGPGTDHLSVDRTHARPLHFVAGPGTGSKPLLKVFQKYDPNTRIGTFLQGYIGEVVFSEIDHEGLWDVETETGQKVGCYSLRAQGSFLWDRCKFSKIEAFGCSLNDSDPDTGASVSGQTSAQRLAAERENARRTRVMLVDCEGGTTSSYSIFATGLGKIALLGTRFAHAALARSGGNYRTPAPPANSSGPFREESPYPCDMVVDCCDMFTRQGWYDNGLPWRTIQPCFRFNTNGYPGHFVNIQRSSFEGGHTMVSTTREHGGEKGVVSPLLMEQSVLVASHSTLEMIAVPGMGFTVRACLFVNPNVPSASGDFTLRRVVHATYQRGWSGNPSEEFPDLYRTKGEVSGCTLLDLRSTPNATGQNAVLIHRSNSANPAAWTGAVVSENNVVHKPNYDVPVIGQGPLSLAPLWQAREVHGPIISYQRTVGTFPAAFPRGATLTLPYAAGTTYADYIPQGQPNPKSWVISGPPMTIEHRPEGIRVTNIGTQASDDRAQGSSYVLEIDRSTNPATYPQYGTPANALGDGKTLPGSAARGAGDYDGAGTVAMDGATYHVIVDVAGKGRPAAGATAGAWEAPVA